LAYYVLSTLTPTVRAAAALASLATKTAAPTANPATEMMAAPVSGTPKFTLSTPTAGRQGCRLNAELALKETAGFATRNVVKGIMELGQFAGLMSVKALMRNSVGLCVLKVAARVKTSLLG